MLAERLAAELDSPHLLKSILIPASSRPSIRSGDLAELPANSNSNFRIRRSPIAIACHTEQGHARRGRQPGLGRPLLSVPDERFYAVLKAGDEWRMSAEWQGETSLMLRPSGAGDDDGR